MNQSYLKTLSLFFLIATFYQLPAQTLPEALKALEKELTTVESKKLTYQHALSFDQEKPYNVTLSVSEQGKKNTEDLEYSFNLVDLNPRLISWRAKGDVIEFKVQTQKKQKFIEVSKNGELDNYDSEVSWYASSSDNARAMEKALERCIELAEPLFKSELEIASYEEGVDWLIKNVKAVTVKDKRFDQQLSKLEDYSTVFELITVEEDKQEDWIFNMADLRPSSVLMEVSGQKVSLSVKTERLLKYITTQKEGEKGSYVNELEILVSSIEVGRFMTDVWSKTITFSQALAKEQESTVESTEEAFAQARPLIKKAVSRTGEVSQELLTEDCSTTLQKNGKESEKLVFNFADLNAQTVEIKISTKYLSLAATTKEKELLIKELRDGELYKYAYDLAIDMDHIEEAKQLERTLTQLIQQCESARTYSFPESASEDTVLGWLVEHIPSFQADTKEYEQSLEVSEDDPCSLTFTQIESTEKKSTTEVFEFSLVDIDPKDIQYAIRSKELAISVEADNKQKYIKHYKDDETEDYLSSFKVYLNEVELARNVKQALAVLAEGCE